MNGMLMLHVAAIAFWIGVVGAEFVIERSRADSKPHGFAVAHNHFWIDVFLELPAVAVVLISGAWLLCDTAWTPLLAVKVTVGVLAAVSNIVCIVPVATRRRAATQQQLDAVIRHSRSIDRITVFSLPASVVAMVIGFYLAR
jgi:putative copper export protein